MLRAECFAERGLSWVEVGQGNLYMIAMRWGQHCLWVSDLEPPTPEETGQSPELRESSLNTRKYEVLIYMDDNYQSRDRKLSFHVSFGESHTLTHLRVSSPQYGKTTWLWADFMKGKSCAIATFWWMGCLSLNHKGNLYCAAIVHEYWKTKDGKY